MKAPHSIETRRLTLHKPESKDAEAIFRRYASDPEVTRFLAWPRHQTVEATRGFLAFSDGEWQRWPAGPYLVRSRWDGLLLGSTGLAFESPVLATTGYVFARDAWGKGYATESTRAMIDLARRLGVQRLDVHCHVDHMASRRVLEKVGLDFVGISPEHSLFPNLDPETKLEVASYRLDIGIQEGS